MYRFVSAANQIDNINSLTGDAKHFLISNLIRIQ